MTDPSTDKRKKTKYDPSYRRLFSHPRMVEDLLKRYVAGEWLDQLDFSTLELVPAHYVDAKTLEDRENDLIWRLRSRDDEDDWFYVFIMLEFQSTVERFMGIRVLCYLMLFYQSLIQAGHLTQDGKLPPVLPVVLYNGRRPWTAKVQTADLIDELLGLGEFIPRFKYLVIDETHLTEEELGPLDNPVTAVFQLEQIRGPDQVRQVIETLLDILDDPELRDLYEDFLGFINAVVIPARLQGQNVLEANDLLEVRSMFAERVMEWTQEWKAEGVEEGRLEGRQEGKMELLRSQFELRFGVLPGWAIERLQKADPETIDRWGRRIFDAQTLEDVLSES